MAGYAAVFAVRDRAGDVIAPGAFGHVEPVPLLHGHRGGAVGRIDAIGEDARGLRIEAVVEDAGVAALVRGGALRGLSVGYRPVLVEQGARRVLRRVTLIEVSLVAVPMQALARVDEVFNEEQYA
jgi:hypothetical protein